ncbi:MAG: elongation factor G [Sandaracinaceae bacterium]
MTGTIAISRQRNLGIIAHVDAGKTTLTERILFHAGRIHRIGGVDEGTTTTDHRPEEQAKGITITAAAVSCAWGDHALTLIDTPGHVDFTMEVERSLRVLDGAVVLLDAVAGVEPQTETVWRQAERHGVPRIAFVNKLDRAGADLDRAVRSLRDRLGVRPLVLTLPDGEPLSALLDVVRRERVTFDEEGRVASRVPCDDPRIDAAREALVEACAELDEALLESFVESRDVSAEALLAALRRGTLEGRWLPVLAGSAYRNVGVPLLLDAVVALLPDPSEAAPLAEGWARAADAPLAGLCFKVDFDTFGALAFVRVYAGVLRRGDVVAVQSRKLRVGRLVRLFAAQREDVEEAPAGSIVALVSADLSTGDTLSEPSHPISLEPVRAPDAVMRVAIEPRTRSDRDRLPKALARLRVADPSLRVIADPDTGQTLLGGMGQLHLEIAVSRLSTEHGVTVDVGAPRVAYRETVSSRARVDEVLRKQTGGPGLFAHVVMELEPASPGEGFVFEDRIRGGAIPREYVSGVRKGVEAALGSGVLGHPVVDVRVRLLDGSTHPNDSSEHAFALCAEQAFRAALRQAGPVLLEPLVRLEVHAPEAHVGDLIGDLSARRGRILGMETERDLVRVEAEAPLAELFGYATDLASLARGRGTHHLELARYAPAPEGVRVRS